MGSHMSSWERNRDEGKVRWNHVHGDSHPAIKPQNLYLTNNSGRIKLPKFKGVQPKRQTWRIQWPSWPTPWEFVTHGLACDDPSPFNIVFFFFSFIFISWRLFTLQYCSGFCHTLTWISHGFTCVPHPSEQLLGFSYLTVSLPRDNRLITTWNGIFVNLSLFSP